MLPHRQKIICSCRPSPHLHLAPIPSNPSNPWWILSGKTSCSTAHQQPRQPPPQGELSGSQKKVSKSMCTSFDLDFSSSVFTLVEGFMMDLLLFAPNFIQFEMDRSWIYNSALFSPAFLSGVLQFMEYVRGRYSADEKIKCPFRK